MPLPQVAQVRYSVSRFGVSLLTPIFSCSLLPNGTFFPRRAKQRPCHPGFSNKIAINHVGFVNDSAVNAAKTLFIFQDLPPHESKHPHEGTFGIDLFHTQNTHHRIVLVGKTIQSIQDCLCEIIRIRFLRVLRSVHCRALFPGQASWQREKSCDLRLQRDAGAESFPALFCPAQPNFFLILPRFVPFLVTRGLPFPSGIPGTVNSTIFRALIRRINRF